MRPARLVVAIAAVIVIGGIAAWASAVQTDLATPYDRHNRDYAGSDTCRTCHSGRYETWHRTWHRTMTQVASEESVVGAFDGRVVEYWGVPIRPTMRDGRHVFEYLSPDRERVLATAEITHTVGSHRYQQYLTRQPGTGNNEYRLQLLWHIGEQRWVHMNGVFLHDDNQGFSDRVAVWNQNCIFCHNTGPKPNIVNYDEIMQRVGRGENVDFGRDMRFDSEVAELGIACETCHGPGAEHARRNRDPLRRYWLQLSDAADPTIVHPARLPAERSAEVCGQCHSQRVPARQELALDWLQTGPTYRPGDRLSEHVRVITAEEPGPPNQPDMFRKRFWEDGTARLSAYEFLGVKQSACYQGRELSCRNCHDAHGGDPNGMMRDDGRTNAPCLACHEGIAAGVAQHTRHAEDSAGSQCVNCHMPKMVYGVMAIHRSHRIEVPDPLADANNNRPNACAGCHLDRTAQWAAEAIASWTGTATLTDAASTAVNIPEHLRQLLGGDPVQRAVAAHLAGRDDSALPPTGQLSLVPSLLLSMEDGYPGVRRFAARSLEAIARRVDAVALADAAAAFDFIEDPEVRNAQLDEVRSAWDALQDSRGMVFPPPNPEVVSALRAQAAERNVGINIGE